MIQYSFFIFPTCDIVTCTYNNTWRSIGVSGYNDWWQHLQCYEMMTKIRQKESQNSVVVMRPILHGLKCIYCIQCKIKQLIQKLDSICIKKITHKFYLHTLGQNSFNLCQTLSRFLHRIQAIHFCLELQVESSWMKL